MHIKHTKKVSVADDAAEEVRCPTLEQGLFWGASWYPDHWPRESWDRDLSLMRKAGMRSVRFGESSWTRFEPNEGQYDWSLLDDVLEMLAAYDMDLILGTPTYAAPAWLKERYPAAIAARADGSRWYRQNRRTYDYTNPDYRRCCRLLVAAMAERYAHHPRILAWQVDNELFNTLDEFYGDSVTTAFQEWLHERYGTIGSLNHAWGLMFWSCQLDHFGQVDLPGPVPSGTNPHQKADYLRFISDLGIGFLEEQAALIRAVNPSAQILHNCPFGAVDRTKLFASMDIFGLDQYPGFAPTQVEKKIPSLNVGEARPLVDRIWVVEQQAAQPGSIFNRAPRSAPGETALLALQSIGAGADAVLWFNWRTCPVGVEMIWDGILPAWGEPGAMYAEVRDLIARLAPHRQRIAATKSVVEVVRLLNHTQTLLYRCEPWVPKWVGIPWDGRGTLRALNLNEDQMPPRMLRPDADYRVALLPHAVAMDAEEVEAITAWVRAGGTLIVGPLAGHRDGQLHLPTDTAPPGLLGRLTGTSNTQDTVWREVLHLAGCDGSALAYDGKTAGLQGAYAEVLEPVSSDVVVRARYQCGWLEGLAAMTERPFGSGRVIHCGVPLADAPLAWLWRLLELPQGAAPLHADAPEVEILSRESADETFHFVLNHGDATATITAVDTFQDLITEAIIDNAFILAPREWRILVATKARS